MDDLENKLAEAIEEDTGLKAMAQRLAPRDFTELQQRGMKPSMVPIEHFAESLSVLNKTLAELKSLRVKLIGEVPTSPQHKPVEMRQAELAKKPVVTVLHEQADDVMRLASDMSAVIAQIREKL